MEFDELFGILLKRVEDIRSDILTIQDMVERRVDDESLYELRDWVESKIKELEDPSKPCDSIGEMMEDDKLCK